MAQLQSDRTDRDAAVCRFPQYSRHAVFDHCPQCGGEMKPEHAHFRCGGCGWRDSCCD